MKPTIIPIPLGPFGVVNAYLLRGGERTVLVDTGFPGSGAQILAALKKNGIPAKTVSLILLTHSHIDHIGSVFEVKEGTGAPVAVHDSELPAVRTGVPPPLVPINSFGRMIRGYVEKKTARPIQPDIAIIGVMELAEFGVDARVIETPGHTSGSVSIVFREGPAIAGDLLAAGFPAGGFLWRDRPAQPPFQEDIRQVYKSLQKLMKHKPTKIYLGHGGPVTPASVRAFMEHDKAFAGMSAG